MNDPAALVRSTVALAKAPCLTCSFQAEDVVVLHMLRQIRPGVPLLFLDTVHHFAETYVYRDRLATQWNHTLVTLRAERPVAGLWQTSTNECRALHKVAPLFQCARSPRYVVHRVAARAVAEPSGFAGGGGVQGALGEAGGKSQPACGLDDRAGAGVRAAARAALLPLYNAGYASIGCEPCIRLPTDPANPRSGRRRGEELECGIHLQPAPELPAV